MSSTTKAPPRPVDRPVWVDLDSLYGEPDESIAACDDPPPGGYLQATGRVPGLLRRWTRAVDGRWFGCRPCFELTADSSVADRSGKVEQVSLAFECAEPTHAGLVLINDQVFLAFACFEPSRVRRAESGT